MSKNDFIPKEVREGLYNPDFIPNELNINEFFENEVENRKTNTKKINKQIQKATLPTFGGTDVTEPQKPLTEAEAELVDEHISKLKDRIAFTRNRINNLISHIDNVANPENGNEFSLILDISNKPTVKRAIQRVFGIKTDTISYSLYKIALSTKRNLEDTEAQKYVDGSFDLEE